MIESLNNRKDKMDQNEISKKLDELHKLITCDGRIEISSEYKLGIKFRIQHYENNILYNNWKGECLLDGLLTLTEKLRCEKNSKLMIKKPSCNIEHIIQCPDCEMEFHNYDGDFEGIPEHICLNDEVK